MYHSAIDRRAIPAAARESLWQTADGHPVRRIDWPGNPADVQGAQRGSILFLPGRGDFYEKYLETLDHWHGQGWRVTASDWRGQAGSGRLGNDAVTGHVGDFSVWVHDLAKLWRQWTAETPAPHVLACHSMGGHLGLRTLAEGRIDPAALVLSAPMLGFTGPPLPLALLQKVAQLMCRLGDPARPAWKWSEKPGEMPAARELLLTHDPARYADELWWREARPELVMGPGSWRWVERAYASTRTLFAPGMLEGVTTPVLLLAASEDRLVGYNAIKEAGRRLPHAELVAFGAEARHEILREADPLRDRALAAIECFLDQAAPRP